MSDDERADDDLAADPGDDSEERHHVSVDSDEGPAIDGAGSPPEGGGEDEIGPAPGFGAPDDPSDEQPMLVASPSDEAPALPAGGEPPSELQQAYECLELRTPIDEFLAFAEARRETLVRLGDVERSAVAAEALETGLRALREVMGAVPAARREPQ